MENIAEALKLAGFTLLFVIALSIAMITIMQGKRTSETIISYSDKTKYYSNIEENVSKVEKGNRIVQIKDIIPTLYRYDQEQYIVIFNNTNGEPLKVSEDSVNLKKRNDELITGENTGIISYLNYNLESKLEENWSQNHSTIKKHVDSVVKTLFDDKYKKRTFKETITTTKDIYYNNVGIDLKNDENAKQNKDEIRVITYTLQ